jgi:hypothetical protein
MRTILGRVRLQNSVPLIAENMQFDALNERVVLRNA